MPAKSRLCYLLISEWIIKSQNKDTVTSQKLLAFGRQCQKSTGSRTRRYLEPHPRRGRKEGRKARSEYSLFLAKLLRTVFARGFSLFLDYTWPRIFVLRSLAMVCLNRNLEVKKLSPKTDREVFWLNFFWAKPFFAELSFAARDSKEFEFQQNLSLVHRLTDCIY